MKKPFISKTLSYGKDGLVVKNRVKVGIPERMNLIVGTLEGTRRICLLIAESQDEEDVYKNCENTNGALHGDGNSDLKYELSAKREGEVYAY